MVAYHYDFRIALVKGSPNTVAANATVLVYDPADTGYVTPLTVYSDPALTTIVNLVTDAYGIVPDFWTNNLPDLLWKSGTMKGGWATTSSRPGSRGPAGVAGPAGPPGQAGTPGSNGEVARWVANTVYPLNLPVVNPDGDLVRVTAAHTSGATYDATKFQGTNGAFAAALSLILGGN